MERAIVGMTGWTNRDALGRTPPLAARSSGDRAQGRPYTSDPDHCQPGVAETGRLFGEDREVERMKGVIGEAFCRREYDLLRYRHPAHLFHQSVQIGYRALASKHCCQTISQLLHFGQAYGIRVGEGGLEFPGNHERGDYRVQGDDSLR